MERRLGVAVKGIIVNSGRALLIQRSCAEKTGPHTWECAGGKLEFGEGLEDALRREIAEEVALSVKVERLLYATTFMVGEEKHVVILTYLCTTTETVPTLSFEHENYLWANESDMRALLSQHILEDFDRNGVWDTVFPKGERHARD